jgi:hypothetical protein
MMRINLIRDVKAERKQAYNKAYAESNAERLREERKAAYAANPPTEEQREERNRQARAKHAEFRRFHPPIKQKKLPTTWRERNRDVAVALTNDWCRRNPDKRRNAHLLRTYGISLADQERMIVEQGGACALCREMFPEKRTTNTLHVDHCHTTKKVRGILCMRCNTGLGALGDTVESLERALAYLRGVRCY